MKASIIIATLNRPKRLMKTLDYFVSDAKKSNFEVIVIDQSDEIDSDLKVYLEKHKNQIHWFRCSRKNLPAARNYGAKKAKNEVLIFIDDDVLIGEKFVQSHLLTYVDEKVAGAGGSIVCDNGLTEIVNSQVIEKHVRGALRGELNVSPNFNENYFYRSLWVRGCNMSFKKNWWEKVGGFDENFYGSAYGEESEFCHRITNLGGVLIYNPFSRLDHLQQEEGGCRDENQRGYVRSRARSAVYFHRITGSDLFKILKELFIIYRAYVLNKKLIFSPFASISYHLFFVCGIFEGLFKAQLKIHSDKR